MGVRHHDSPVIINLILLVLSSIVCMFFLWLASHSSQIYIILLCSLGFGLTANTVFSLLHEAVHGIFSSQRVINEWAGRLAACWFPTSFKMQRAFHLTHHKNNRSHEEQFDVMHDGDIKWLKYAQWYSILTGLYWLITVLGIALYLLLPWVSRLSVLKSHKSQVGKQTSSSAYLSAINEINSTHARLEIILAVSFHVVLFWSLNLTWWGWLSCYAGFALLWSSLQFTDHAYSELDTKMGAWNLSVSPLTRAFFLNYHYHLAHHQQPSVPWNQLSDYVEKGSFQPSFWKVWFAMWRGPRRPSEIDDVII